MFNYRSRNGSTANGRDANTRTAVAAQSLGMMLRERREALGASLAEIESATKIRQKYLSALESDEWQLLPGEVIGRGFLSNYSTYLGLESTELVDRRRAITDPTVISVLSNTSAGVRLPAEREVDYRPREMDLREDTDIIEGRQLRVGPYLVGLLSLALVALIGWGLYQYGGAVRRQLSGIFDSVSAQIAQALASEPTPTPQDVPLTSAPTATATQAVVAGQNTPAASDAAAPNNTTGGGAPDTQPQPTATTSGLLLPTPTNTAEAVVAPTATLPPPTPTPPTPPTPPAQLAALNTNANFRSGPGTTFDITGAGLPGQQVTISGRSADGQWYQLSDNSWVFGQLVTNPPANVPVIEQPAAPAAEAAPEATQPPAEQPVAPPAQSAPVTAAACPADASISFPGVNQAVAGAVTVSGTANREPFQSWKIEVNGAFIGSGGARVIGGALLSFDSTGFANGAATILLTSVDNTGNFSQCAVPVVIQN